MAGKSEQRVNLEYFKQRWYLCLSYYRFLIPFRGHCGDEYLSYQYRCVVSGTCAPAATSSAAVLTVNTSLPSITTGPSSATICPNGSTHLRDRCCETGLVYQWQESTNGGTVWNTLSNTGVYSTVTTATMNLTSAP